MGFRIWLENLLLEQPHRTFAGNFPSGLEFLKGYQVDLGFEDLKVGEKRAGELEQAFTTRGIAIPKMNCKLRAIDRHDAVIEPIRPGEQLDTLPDHWRQGVSVIVFVGDEPKLTWVGRMVRDDRKAGYNLEGYRDTGEGSIPPN